MITVNGWCVGGMGAVGEWGDECSVNGGDGEDSCPNFLQSFLEKIDRRSCNDGNQELIPVFPNPHRKCRPSPSTETPTLEYHVWVPSREKKQPSVVFTRHILAVTIGS